jgi:hypothetical protein
VEGWAGDRAIRLSGVGGSARVRVGPGATAGRYRMHYRPPLGPVAVVRCHLLIGPFKFKFDCLNMNLTV